MHGGSHAADRIEIGRGSVDIPTFVLVHGAWHGGWCWRKLVPFLRDAGHDVHTPTLTGLGERAHLLTPDIGLATHVADIVGVLVCEDLRDVVLVGHSYGGMVITGVALEAADRIAHLIYLDAFLPESGESAARYSTRVDVRALAASIGDGWRVPCSLRAGGFGVTDPDDAAWVDARVGDHPLRAFTDSLSIPPEFPGPISRSYVLTSQGTFVPHGERAKAAGFGYQELLTAGHDAMVTEPEALAAILDRLATPG